MGTERAWSSPVTKKQGKISAPPGFASRTCFNLNKVEHNEEPPEPETFDIAKLKESFVHRPWILHGHYINNQESSSSGQPVDVTQRQPPEAAHMIVLEDAPLFHPTEEEFGDMIKYVASIRSRIEPHGICRIVPPPSWKPSCIIKEKISNENTKFVSHVQRIDELRNDYLNKNIDMRHDLMMNKRRKVLNMSTEDGKNESAKEFGLESGPEFNLQNFKKHADEFKGQYFCKINKVTDSDEPSIEHIEREYWRIVENRTKEIEVLCGADLKTADFGSGFPVMSNSSETSNCPKDLKSDWNLNNVAKLPHSLLSFESCGTSGVLCPRVHIGMCFSSLHWKAEEHFLYSLWYLHLGAPRIWYGISGNHFIKFQTMAKKLYPNLIGECPELLYNMVRQLPPTILKSEGIPVFRCIQYPGEFVLTLPGAYCSGIDCGFNFSEVGNFAPIDWLPDGQIAVELYCEQGRRTLISYDKLLFRAANEAVKEQWENSLTRKSTQDNLRWKFVIEEGILTSTLKALIKSEEIRRKYLCNSDQFRKMEESFDSTSKRVCNTCLCDLHLSAAGCPCSPDIYSCLIHAKQFCSCGWSSKFFLIRYDMNELNILIEALEGKLSSVYKWARDKLGLSLSYFSKDKSPVPSLAGDQNTPVLTLFNNTEETDKSTGVDSSFLETEKASESSSGSTFGSSIMSGSLETEIGKSAFGFQMTKKKRLISDLISDAPSTCRLEEDVNSTESHKQKNAGCSAKPVPDIAAPSNDSSPKNELTKRSSARSQGTIIILSDDEDDE